MNEIEWALRQQFIDQYLSITSHAIELYQKAKLVGDPRFVIQQVLQRMTLLPPWVGHRALRFATLVKLKHYDDVGFTTERIDTAFITAKLGTAFISVVCKTLGTSKDWPVSLQERMDRLLAGPNDAGETVYKSDGLVVNPDSCTALFSGDSTHTKAEVSSQKEPDQKAENSMKPVRCHTVCKLPQALCGWDERGRASMGINDWNDSRECCLCKICGDSDAGVVASPPESWEKELPRLGRLLPLSEGNWIHSFCALWSSEVYETSSDNKIHAVEKARSRGLQLKCFGCGYPGATVGCNKGNCPFNYHYACAKICGATFTANRRVYCPAHKAAALNDDTANDTEPMKALLVAPDTKQKPGSDRDSHDSGNLCPRYGSLIVHCFGKVESSKDGFHSEDYITPPGFVSSRVFWSAEEPRRRTMYVMNVEQDAEGKIEFSITPGDDIKSKITSCSVHEAYETLVRKVRDANTDYFSRGEGFSKLPMLRKTLRRTFGLNGPQVSMHRYLYKCSTSISSTR